MCTCVRACECAHSLDRLRCCFSTSSGSPSDDVHCAIVGRVGQWVFPREGRSECGGCPTLLPVRRKLRKPGCGQDSSPELYAPKPRDPRATEGKSEINSRGFPGVFTQRRKNSGMRQWRAKPRKRGRAWENSSPRERLYEQRWDSMTQLSHGSQKLKATGAGAVGLGTGGGHPAL